MTEKELWKACVEFHGHECPGLAIGYRAAKIAKEKMGLVFSRDEEVICITENDACGVDAIQYITGCTLGKGNLILNLKGKMAFTFIKRSNNKALRVILNPSKEEMGFDQRKNYILEGPEEEVFKTEWVDVKLPAKAIKFPTIICEKCDEGAAENKIRLQDGKKVCLDCFNNYSRGW